MTTPHSVQDQDAGFTLVVASEMSHRIETFTFPDRQAVEDHFRRQRATSSVTSGLFSHGHVDTKDYGYRLTGPGVPIPPNCGDREIHYTLTPKTLDGGDINHGMSYWNCNTAAEALASARTRANGTYLGIPLGAVEIVAREVELGHGGWSQVAGGYFKVETIARTAPIEFGA